MLKKSAYITCLFATSIWGGASACLAADAPQWEELTFLRYKPITFTQKAEQIDIVSNGASSLLYRPLSEAEKKGQTIDWSWHIAESSVPPTMLGQSPGDDRPIAIYLFFSKEPNMEMTSSALAKGHYLAYVWGSAHPTGSVIDSEDGRGKFIIIRDHDDRKPWHQEQRNYIADFQKAFGMSAYPAMIAVIADTDDTKSTTRASIKDIQFITQKHEDNLQLTR